MQCPEDSAPQHSSPSYDSSMVLCPPPWMSPETGGMGLTCESHLGLHPQPSVISNTLGSCDSLHQILSTAQRRSFGHCTVKKTAPTPALVMKISLFFLITGFNWGKQDARFQLIHYCQGQRSLCRKIYCETLVSTPTDTNTIMTMWVIYQQREWWCRDLTAHSQLGKKVSLIPKVSSERAACSQGFHPCGVNLLLQ